MDGSEETPKDSPSSAALTSWEKKLGGNLFETSKLSASIPWNNNPSSVKDFMIILNSCLTKRFGPNLVQIEAY